jgi:hypothetical protein
MTNYQLQATIARKNEQRSRENEQKYQTYLYNALVLLQEQMSLTDDELSSIAQEEIGMTLNDFNKIMPQK